MSIQAIKCALVSGALRKEVLDLPLGRPQRLESFTAGGQAMALVIPDRHLEDVLHAMKDLVEDQSRTKSGSKGLADKALKQPSSRAPVLRHAYKHPGQAQRSVCTLLNSAQKAGQERLFVVVMPDAVFDQVLAASQEGASGERAAKALRAPLSMAGDDLYAQCPPLEVIPYIAGEDDLANKYLGSSDDARLVRRLIVYAAQAAGNDPVLIVGETGTGKDEVARLIRDARNAHLGARPFIPVNCGGLPETLLESELFGSLKGAYTDAKEDRRGLWETAGNGILFLDEIGDMPLSQQAKVLRAVHSGTIRRVGATREIDVEARVLAATNRDLFALVQRGLFREDLYYRLRGFIIRTPALRANPQDIGVLVAAFWEKATAKKEGNSLAGGRPPLSPQVVQCLSEYGWPGNARELKLFLRALHNHFPRKEPTVQDVKVLARMLGSSLGPQRAPASPLEARGEDLALHRAQCLRHLKLVEEALEGAKRVIDLLASRRRVGAQETRAFKDALRRASGELQNLCLPEKRLLFHGERCHHAVAELSRQFFSYACQLDGGPFSALSFWAAGIAGQVEKAISTVFKEIERILREA